MLRSEISELDRSQLGQARFKLCMAGCPAVGKTKLLIRYQSGTYWDTSTMTLVDHLPIRKTVNGRECVFDYYDTAGQEVYRSMVSLYLRNTHACIFVYDVTMPSTLEKLDDFIRIVEEISPEAIKIIVGNKSDLEDACNDSSLEKYRAKGIRCYKASAKSNLNVTDIFTELENRVLKECKPSNSNSDKLRPSVPPKPISKCC